VFQLGIISDEISPDCRRACTLAAQWGLDFIELRTFNGRNLLQLGEEELQEIERALRESGLRVSGVSSPVFKASLDGLARDVAADFALPGSESHAAQVALLEKALALCERFDAPVLRVFTFWREPWTPALAEEVASKIVAAVEQLPPSKVTIAIENEPVCNVGTGAELGELFATLERLAPAEVMARLSALWDPGNALATGEEAYPDGYACLRGAPIRHVHLKDLDNRHGEPNHFVPVGQGRLDYREQLLALWRDGYRGPLVLEPHYKDPKLSQEGAAEASVRAAQALLASLDLQAAGAA
jgi:L-ribulose-5-phosphate 3-epimerase